MDIWIIQNGEKIGPLHDFEIRRKIETGELPRETPAWHEGLAGWKSLAEIEVFSREFELAAKPSTPTPDVFSPEVEGSHGQWRWSHGFRREDVRCWRAWLGRQLELATENLDFS